MENSNGQERVVVVIEDDNAIRSVFQKYLEHQFRVLLASTGEEGITLISGAITIDLLITDFDLKGPLDGLDMMRAMRKKNPVTPIILCTGSPVQESRIREALSIPGMVLISKPFNLEEFDHTIKILPIAKKRPS